MDKIYENIKKKANKINILIVNSVLLKEIMKKYEINYNLNLKYILFIRNYYFNKIL